ncbi:MAG: Alpha-ketoacid dehydrogenase subunit beta [Actinomycetia bacterium]|nr:Alpha-ketoacid dehydrogenase subunit beta [Actinomycetes bacterium]
MDSTSTVAAVAAHLAATGRGTGPVALVGFDASRHLARGHFAPPPVAVDMPICEETMLGLALGMASAGRDVVVDLMFEGFLARCLEPLLVGLPTARSFAAGPFGRLVVRALGGPIPFGGPSHANLALHALAGVPGIAVVHIADEADLAWALTAPQFADGVLVLIDLPLASRLASGQRIYLTGGHPALLWDHGADTLTVCSHAQAQALVPSGSNAPLATDVLSLPAEPSGPRSAALPLPRHYRQVSWSGAGEA